MVRTGVSATLLRGARELSTAEMIQLLREDASVTSASFFVDTPEELEDICVIPQLEELDLNLRCPVYSAQTAASLAKLRNLQRLRIVTMRFATQAEEILAALASLPLLQKLEFIWDQAPSLLASSAEISIEVPRFESLTFLDLSGDSKLPYSFAPDFAFDKITELHFSMLLNQADIAQFKRLETLHMSFVQLEPAGWRALADMQWLHSLTLQYCDALTIPQLELIAGLRELRELDAVIRNCNDDVLRKFAALPHLQRLTLGMGINYENDRMVGWPVDTDGVAFKEFAKNGTLTALELPNWKLNEKMLEAIAQIQTLKTLSFYPPDDEEPYDIRSLSGLENLQNICLPLPEQGRMEFLSSFACVGNLLEVDLSNQGLTDSDMDKVLQFRSAHTLYLDQNPLNGSGLSTLAALSALRRLSLGSTQITDSSIAQLRNEQLEAVNVSNTEVTEQGIRALSKLPGLKSVQAHECGIKPGSVFPPNLQVAWEVGWYEHDYDEAKVSIQVGGETKSIQDYTDRLESLLNPEFHVCSVMATQHVQQVFECHLGRGIAYSALGNFEKALEDLNDAVQLARASAFARTNRGYALFKLGRLDEALTDLTRAIELKPHLEAAHKHRKKVLKALGQLS